MPSASTPRKKLFYLHIPKCGGVSLLSCLTEALAQPGLFQSNRIFQTTSVIQHLWQNQPEFFDIFKPRLLRVIYGHWVHEELAKLLLPNLLLATALRDPLERIRSQYRFDQIRRQSGIIVDADLGRFLSDSGNVVCPIVARSFPSIARRFAKPAEAALYVLSGFDFIYHVDDSTEKIPQLLTALDLPPQTVARLNSSETATEELPLPTAELARHCEDDYAVYEAFTAARALRPTAENPLYDGGAAAEIRQLLGKGPVKWERLMRFYAPVVGDEYLSAISELQVHRFMRRKIAFDRAVLAHLEARRPSEIKE